MNSITLRAYAKINLYLDILGVLPNGYHEIESIMQSVSIYDEIEINKTSEKGIIINCDDPQIPCDNRNIAFKAAKLISEELNYNNGFEISIKKNIPVKAGMGGGSADCAAVLMGINMLFNKTLGLDKLIKIGKSLGADVPFCIVGGTKLCKGIGEIVADVPQLEKLYLVIVQPNFCISTQNAYRIYDENPINKKGKIDTVINSLSTKNTENLAKNMYNIFEELYKYPDINKIKAEFSKNDAIGSLMTGSGSAVFGIFNTYENALICKNNIDYPFVQIAETMSRSMDVLTK
ncbi:MAG: 4-(cytidine 5'-diphospho)-2-C-methyl-D-erythritol kinase [Clostridiales bacterium]|nr:4-(cytidine 5'-diphospho)-2-C-methyl-D-erythritol kinase [Clostridiales bacterium]